MLVLLGAAALTVAGCGVTVGSDTPLATVKIGTERSVDITQDEVAEMIDGIANSPRFVQGVYGGTVPEGNEQFVLSQMIRAEVLRAEAADLGVTPTDTTDAVRELDMQLQQVMSGVDPGDPAVAAEEVRDELGPYFDLIADSFATNEAVSEAFAAESEGGVPCVRHILVDAADTELAEDLIAQLEGGADFATLAVENSTGPSGPQGGELGCSDPQGFVAEFRDAVLAAEVGEFVGPVETEFGLHVLEVTGYEDPAQIQARFAEMFDDVNVSVDPDFGTWDTVEQQVVPPTES